MALAGFGPGLTSRGAQMRTAPLIAPLIQRTAPRHRLQSRKKLAAETRGSRSQVRIPAAADRLRRWKDLHGCQSMHVALTHCAHHWQRVKSGKLWRPDWGLLVLAAADRLAGISALDQDCLRRALFPPPAVRAPLAADEGSRALGCRLGAADAGGSRPRGAEIDFSKCRTHILNRSKQGRRLCCLLSQGLCFKQPTGDLPAVCAPLAAGEGRRAVGRRLGAAGARSGRPLPAGSIRDECASTLL